MNTEVKKSEEIKKKYAEVCTQVGDLTFKLEDLKTLQWQLSKDYKEAVQAEQQPQSDETPVAPV